MENPVAQPGCRGKMVMIGYFYFPHGPSLSFVIDLSALFWFLLTMAHFNLKRNALMFLLARLWRARVYRF